MQNIIVLVEPEIPYNTGNIARTCVATNTALHLVRPLGFELSDKHLKRAGLDYWPQVQLILWDNFEKFQEVLETLVREGYCPIYATTKAGQDYGKVDVSDRPAVLIFGKETAGLPEDFLFAHPERCYRIPMYREQRSLNLSNAEAILLYEVLRQQGFPGLH